MNDAFSREDLERLEAAVGKSAVTHETHTKQHPVVGTHVQHPIYCTSVVVTMCSALTAHKRGLQSSAGLLGTKWHST